MISRRTFLSNTALAAAGIASAHVSPAKNNQTRPSEKIVKTSFENYPATLGLGGVALGNGWHVNPNDQITDTLEAAWKAGIRYFDTSPFYGYGLSERRLGHFLFEKERDEFTVSTKIGRILDPDADFKANPNDLWKGDLNFTYKYDYTAEGTRQSIEESMQRLGLSQIDTVFVHDLSPDNGDMGDDWEEYFEVAKNGAFPELTKMREEGIIKSWGMGVNRPEPILKALEVAEPDVMLVAIQYSLFEHKHALNHVFPAMEEQNVKAIIGGPLNGGFGVNRDKWNYGSSIPAEMEKKRAKINDICKSYDVNLGALSLQFCAAHPVVASVIPGASKAEQVLENVESSTTDIPADLWNELKEEGLIEKNVPVTS